MNKILSKIKTRSYCKTTIRPNKFIKDRIKPITKLISILEKTSVEKRGWDFPHLDYHDKPKIDLDFISSGIDWSFHLEAWRFYQSGQFCHFCGLWEEWRDQSDSWPPHNNWNHGRIIWIDDTIYRFTEIFEFASRLAMTEAGDDEMEIQVEFYGLSGRRLASGPENFPVFEKIASIENFPQEIKVNKADLLSKHNDYALEFAMQFFHRFHWNPTIQILQDTQQKLYRT